MIGAFILLAAATASDNPLKTFKDWTVGCDNGRTCMAVGQFPENDYNTLTVAVERGPLAGDRPVIWFRDDGDANPVDWSADGKPLGLKFVAVNDYKVAVAPESTDKALAALLSPAKLMTVVKPGQESYRVSSDGASAALRWIDERQDRYATVTAMVAKGNRPPGAVPQPQDLPVVVRRMPAKLGPPDSISAKEVSKWRNDIFECEDEPSDGADDKVESKRLDATTTLVMITASCASGAYNYLYIPLLVRKGQEPQLAKFEDRGDGSDGEGLYNLYWKDEDPRVLASYMKGRGLGDCGGGTDWVWDGTMFRIVGESMMDDCRGAPGWITTFRARIVDK